MDMINDCGVIYIATGREHILSAVQSANSVRKTNPDLPIHLFADFQRHKVDLGEKGHPFTSWQDIPEPHRRSKVDYMSLTPFDQTLYLDTDTRVLCDLRDCFNLLQNFDVALAHAHKREVDHKQTTLKVAAPKSFPQFNSGVFFYKKNRQTIEMLTRWRDWFYELKLPTDQNSLREVLWDSPLRIATLPPEYNVRYLKYFIVWSREEALPKILHLPIYRKNGFLFYFNQWKRRLWRVLFQK